MATKQEKIRARLSNYQCAKSKLETLRLRKQETKAKIERLQAELQSIESKGSKLQAQVIRERQDLQALGLVDQNGNVIHH